MGLDNFASKSEVILKLSDKDIEAFKKENINLCEGTFSDGEVSFRGKVYEKVVLEITGVSLFEYWIPPEKVYEMWQDFENCNLEEYANDHPGVRHLDPDSINELRKFFMVCAKRKLGLIGWW